MRRPTFQLVFALFFLSTFAPLIGDDAQWNRAAFLEKVQLIPATGREMRVVTLDYLEKERGNPFTEAERALYNRRDDGKWRVFEDDLIRFEVPDDPLLSIEVITPQDRAKLKVVGGAIGTTDRFFTRAYKLSVTGNNPYGIILLRKADWFDLGICLCGAVVFEKFRLTDGTLQRFSLLENGEIKKVQAIGKQHRVVLFEWTHSMITQDVYARIGASLRLKEPNPRTRDEWRAFATEQEGKGWNDVAWLESGDDEKAVIQVLGDPAERKDSALIYTREEPDAAGGGTRYTLTVPLKDGKFRGFVGKRRQIADIPPARGTANWAGRLIDPDRWANPNTREDGIPWIPGIAPSNPPPELSKENRDVIFAAFVDAEKNYNAETWESWCSVLEAMAEREIRDQRVIDAVRRRYLDPKHNAGSSTGLIKLYQPEDSQQLYAQRIKVILKNEIVPENQNPQLRTMEDARTLNLLFEYMDRKDPEYRPSVRAAIKHTKEDFRLEGLANADALPPNEAREAAWKEMLDGRNPFSIHRACDIFRKLGTAEDVSRLREQLALKKDVSDRRVIEAAIEEIERRGAKTPKGKKK